MSGLIWFLTSLLAVAIVGYSELGGLATAVLGGVALTISVMLESSHQRKSSEVASTKAAHSPIGWIVANELWILILLAPFFMFPRRAFIPIFALVPLFGILRWRVRGQLTRRTPLDVPVILLLVTLAIGSLVSPDLDRSLPKLAGVLLGIGVYYAIINWIDSRRDVEWLCAGIAVAGAVMAAVVLVGTDWIISSKIIPVWIYAVLPRVLTNIPGTIQGLIHPNEAGGSLAFLVPFLSSLLVMPGDTGQTATTILRWPEKLYAFFTRQGQFVLLLIMAAVLVLTQSRSALFGVGVTLLLLFAVRWRIFRWVLLLGIMVFLFLIVSQGSAFIGSLLVGSAGQSGTAKSLDLAGRQEVWQSALYAIRDFPFTGVGLNMFDPVVKALYPHFLLTSDGLIQHAHNNLLQVALDVGIPGLVAYVALVTSFGNVVWLVFAHSPSRLFRAAALGLGLGMLAHQLFGLTDAVTLGSKPGIIFWVMLAMAAGMWTLTPSQASSTAGTQVQGKSSLTK